MPGITIVTPSYNQKTYLEQCIDSVLSQNHPDLEYIIMDGGSTDGSVEIIRKYEKHLAYWQSRPDGGQYHAVNEGFRRSTKPVMGWLNSDDMLHIGGLAVLDEIFSTFPEVEFLTGKRIGFDADGGFAYFDYLDQTWCHDLLASKDLIFKHSLFVMQEGTYWRRSLWERAGGSLDTTFTMAADFELWLRMSRYAPLHTVNALTGGFRCYSMEQRCNRDRAEYVRQCGGIIDRENRLGLTPAPHWQAPPPLIEYPLVRKKERPSFEIVSKRKLPKISIVTPSYNQGEYLEECIDSVLSQNYPNLEYVVMDGGSTDGSKEIIEKYAKHLNYRQSKRDLGHYHAVNSGFLICTGEIMAWLNSDDKYHPGAFALVADAFEAFPEVRWLTGSPTLWDKEGKVSGFSSIPPRHCREKYLNGEVASPYIQQESTFWRRSLWWDAGGTLDPAYPFAGDLELWARFFRHTQLYTLNAPLGGFRSHPGEGQRSEASKSTYRDEAERIVAREREFFSSASDKKLLPSPPPLEVAEIVRRAGSRLTPEIFGFFNYSRSIHFPFFAGSDLELYGQTLPPNRCGIREYQGLLGYTFLRQNLPQGAKVLVVGDEIPRIAEKAQQGYEVWQFTARNSCERGATAQTVVGEIGSFNPALPDGYFDLLLCVTPVAAQSGPPLPDRQRDIARLLKEGGWALHCFDVVDDGAGFRSSPFLPWLFRELAVSRREIPFRQAPLDPFVHALDNRASSQGVWFSWQILWEKRREDAPQQKPNLSPQRQSLIWHRVLSH